MKQCKECEELKDESEFNKDKNRKDGLFPYCKSCCKIRKNAHYRENKDSINEKNYEWRQNNSELKKEIDRRYYEENRDIILIRNKKYNTNNRDKMKSYYLDYMRERRKDPKYRLLDSLRSRLRQAVVFKWGRTMELTGCSIEHLIQHLESQFIDGMSWDNYGQWHIDHIMPCDSFDLLIQEEQQKCFHYTNLQPLWAKDNISKGNKIIS